MFFTIGSEFKSIAVGRRDAFTGTVVGYQGCHYVVEDDKGKRWLRTPEEELNYKKADEDAE